MHDLPVTEAALAASTDLRAVHVVALAHPDVALAAAAQAREMALAAAHDAATPGQLPMAVVAAFRADYRAGMAGDTTYAVLSDGTHVPATSPDLPKRLAASDTSSGDRAALYAAKSRIAFPTNVRVLQTVRAAAAAAAAALITSEREKTTDTTWADVQARPFGGVAGMRARIDAYEASLQPQYEAEVSALRRIAGIAGDGACIPIYDARALMARAAALDKGRDKEAAPPKSLTLGIAWAALRQLLFYLGVDRADTRVDTWAGIPFTVWTVARGDATGEIWVDCAPHARKQLRGITSRFRTRSRSGSGLAYVSVPFGSADSAADITWAQFTTLAHEMGHGLHECLTPGTDEATQHYAEVPSTLLEQLVQTPLMATAIGLGDWAAELLIGGPPFTAHQAMKDVVVARYAMNLFSSDGSENTVPVLTGLLPGYTAAGLDLHEETATPALVTLQSAYYLYILCDAIVAGVLPRIVTRDAAVLAQLWAFVTADDMRLVL